MIALLGGDGKSEVGLSWKMQVMGACSWGLYLVLGPVLCHSLLSLLASMR
jgi:peptidoglycan/LPS O-acetylase OafA/YrhL